jgi:catechol 2,3-dioxygenase-like lactoylglutathione lyase family enzyme
MESTKNSNVDFKLEVVVIPVSDVDRAKSFYGGLGWRLDADNASDDGYFRVIQFTPRGSGCSVIFGKNVTGAAPGSAQGLYLIVSDIKAARDELISRGVEISEVFHDADGVYAGTHEPYLFGRRRAGGLDPEHRSYRSFASFHDPDGNGWLLQEIIVRLPGRVDAARPSPRRPSLRPRSDARRPRTASTRSGPANPIRTGRIGTPTTSSGSRPARSRPTTSCCPSSVSNGTPCTLQSVGVSPAQWSHNCPE